MGQLKWSLSGLTSQTISEVEQQQQGMALHASAREQQHHDGDPQPRTGEHQEVTGLRREGGSPAPAQGVKEALTASNRLGPVCPWPVLLCCNEPSCIFAFR